MTPRPQRLELLHTPWKDFYIYCLRYLRRGDFDLIYFFLVAVIRRKQGKKVFFQRNRVIGRKGCKQLPQEHPVKDTGSLSEPVKSLPRLSPRLTRHIFLVYAPKLLKELLSSGSRVILTSGINGFISLHSAKMKSHHEERKGHMWKSNILTSSSSRPLITLHWIIVSALMQMVYPS